MSLAWDAPKRIVRLEFSRFTSSKATATKGWLLSPPFNIFVPCSIIDLAPKYGERGPQPYPLHCGPIYSTIWRRLPCGRRACDLCYSVRTIPPWGTCACHVEQIP